MSPIEIFRFLKFCKSKLTFFCEEIEAGFVYKRKNVKGQIAVSWL